MAWGKGKLSLKKQRFSNVLDAIVVVVANVKVNIWFGITTVITILIYPRQFCMLGKQKQMRQWINCERFFSIEHVNNLYLTAWYYLVLF